MAAISGEVTKIRYRSEESGFIIFEVRTEGGKPVTVVGSVITPRIGAGVKLEGVWETHHTYGLQFRASSCSELPPATEKAIVSYLVSSEVFGIGPVLAERIVAKFGKDTIRVMEEEPEKLLKVPGIGKKTLEKIVESFKKNKEKRDSLISLTGIGLSHAQALKVVSRYGEESFNRVRENPYALANEIWGIGFKTADDIAAAIGIAGDDRRRLAAGVIYTLGKASEEGHVFLPEDELIGSCSNLLGISEEEVGKFVQSGELREHVQIEKGPDGTRRLYQIPLYNAEVSAAERLAALASMEGRIRVQREFISARFPHFTEKQKRAVERVFENHLSIITGGPGTGKTTIVEAICSLASKAGMRVSLCAPTGRAAKRLSEATGIPASTIHRLLEFNPLDLKFRRNADNPLETDLAIVDEASMIDLLLLNSLLSALPANARVLFVGDSDQLPSVGPGNILRDAIECGAITVSRLTEIFRQEEGSAIIQNARAIISGEMPETWSGAHQRDGELGDFYFIERDNPAEVAATVVELATERIPNRYGFDPVYEIAVLSPMYRGETGVDNLNAAIREAVNKEPDCGMRFRRLDKVMQIVNNYEKEVFNGDVGQVISVDAVNKKIVVRFHDKDLIYGEKDIDELTLAYAISIHKSQGSEYQAVVIPIHTQHYVMLQRNLLYTAVTRGKKLVVLVGTKKALRIAVSKLEAVNRYSLLGERIRKYIS